MEFVDFSRIDGLHHEYQRRISTVINDMYPSVRLIRLEPGHPDFNAEKPYALIDEPNLMTPYVIRTLAESEIDARLVAWLVMHDSQNPDAEINKWEILEMAERALDAKMEMEVLEQKKDLLTSMMKSKKHSYKHDGQTLRK